MNKRRLLAETALVFAVFFLQGAVPVPGINEPYYLGKAAHFWGSNWAENDFFLQSRDTHQVFYFSFGWLALWLPLGVVAWIGRVLTWGLLAWSWRRMNYAILPRPWYSVLSAVLFVALMQHCHISGEWVIGSVEAKGFAFALVFLGIEALLGGKWNRVWLLLGAASAFHVLVGGWSVLAAALAWLWLRKHGPPLRSMWLALLGGFLLSLPGLIPALLINRGADAADVQDANHIYVYQRLTHHLAPMLVSSRFYYRAAILLGAWIVLCRITPADEKGQRLRAFVGGSLAIGLVGLVLCGLGHFQPDAAALLLRFYWFRLVDVVLPLGIVLLVAVRISGELTLGKFPGKIWLVVAIAIAVGQLGFHTVRLARRTPPPAFRLADWYSWRYACDWITQPGNVPADARFITPRMNQTFKWYAGRAEVANWKEIPQDAEAMVEWGRRMHRLYATGKQAAEERWYASLGELGHARLEQMGEDYQADYVITVARPRLPLAVVYPDPERGYPRNPRAVVIYRLSDEP